MNADFVTRIPAKPMDAKTLAKFQSGVERLCEKLALPTPMFDFEDARPEPGK